MMAEYKEMLGKRFHIVQNGLDPNEVTEYLMKDAGSSDTVFKKLEQFSALEQAAKTMEDAIKQARDMAERAKVKAAEEAESRKAQAIEDGKEIAAKIINEAGKSVVAYFDNNSSILMQTMDEAFKKAREQVAGNRTKAREQIEKGVWAEIDRIVKDVDRNARESSQSKLKPTDTSSVDKTPSVVSSTPSDPWQDAR
jgi:ribosomal protein S17E